MPSPREAHLFLPPLPRGPSRGEGNDSRRSLEGRDRDELAAAQADRAALRHRDVIAHLDDSVLAAKVLGSRALHPDGRLEVERHAGASTISCSPRELAGPRRGLDRLPMPLLWSTTPERSSAPSSSAVAA